MSDPMSSQKRRELKARWDDDTGTIDQRNLFSICGLAGTAAQSRLATREAHSPTAAKKAEEAWLRRASEGRSALSRIIKSTPNVGRRGGDGGHGRGERGRRRHWAARPGAARRRRWVYL